MITKYLLIFFLPFGNFMYSQAYLSNIFFNEDNPVYSTYAASLERSEYILNQSYQMVWFDPEKPVSFDSQQWGSWSVIFRRGDEIRSQLNQYYQKPVITASYSDMVKFFYYPFRDLRSENYFLVYSSRFAVQEMKLFNLGASEMKLEVYPFIQNSKQNYQNIKILPDSEGMFFTHYEFPDNWMKEHKIPFREKIRNVFLLSEPFDSFGLYDLFSSSDDENKFTLLSDIQTAKLNNLRIKNSGLISLQKVFTIPAGNSITIRIVRGVTEDENSENELLDISTKLFNENLDYYLILNEKLYDNIPKINFKNTDYESVYWNSFNLIRQCMLPAEGECSYNYYVFSREPRWGWGYGGQVFHESLVMLAYAFMDPKSAMNSQRVFFERQHENGYINYRTGPYLNESIPVNDQVTTSAPWFNWQNLEIFKVTSDTSFLDEAYLSGKKFYHYFIENRDSDKDGLCEWGADAVLESVRDARVAVWDEVGDPANFEALDCNIMLVKEAKSLSEMAKILGLEHESYQWIADAERRSKLINEFMWYEATGFYFHITKNTHSFSFKDENDLKRKEMIAFLALWAGIADSLQAEKLLEHFRNPNEFYRRFGMPSLSADDSYYNPIGYWNGPVWIPWQYLIFRGLLDYGYYFDAADLTKRILDNIVFQLKDNHWFWEFFSADDYHAGWNKTYLWTGLIARFFIDLDNKGLL
jgi:hypothetical protein